jgi:hypothetical protein
VRRGGIHRAAQNLGFAGFVGKAAGKKSAFAEIAQRLALRILDEKSAFQQKG